MDGQPIYPFTQSNTGMPNNATNPWTQVSSATMPWSKADHPNIVRFGESQGDSDSWDSTPKCRLPKRKSDIDFDMKPAKIHITEEKMAAQLRDMHISNSYINNQGFGVTPDNSECLLPTLVLSKEVQSLPTFQEPILPVTLMPECKKATRALVLWRPPPVSMTSQLISSSSTPEDESEGEYIAENANNLATPDLNTMTSSFSNVISSTNLDMEL